MKDVLIEISGTQKSDDNCENIEMTTVGKMAIENGLWKLVYDEDTNIYDKSVTTLALNDEGAVMLDRVGSSSSHLIVQKGHRHMTLYNMGNCEFTIGTFGKVITHDISEHGGDISMKYTVDINASYASTNEIKIKVREI